MPPDNPELPFELGVDRNQVLGEPSDDLLVGQLEQAVGHSTAGETGQRTPRFPRAPPCEWRRRG